MGFEAILKIKVLKVYLRYRRKYIFNILIILISIF